MENTTVVEEVMESVAEAAQDTVAEAGKHCGRYPWGSTSFDLKKAATITVVVLGGTYLGIKLVKLFRETKDEKPAEAKVVEAEATEVKSDEEVKPENLN